MDTAEWKISLIYILACCTAAYLLRRYIPYTLPTLLNTCSSPTPGETLIRVLPALACALGAPRSRRLPRRCDCPQGRGSGPPLPQTLPQPPLPPPPPRSRCRCPRGRHNWRRHHCRTYRCQRMHVLPRPAEGENKWVTCEKRDTPQAHLHSLVYAHPSSHQFLLFLRSPRQCLHCRGPAPPNIASITLPSTVTRPECGGQHRCSRQVRHSPSRVCLQFKHVCTIL